MDSFYFLEYQNKLNPSFQFQGPLLKRTCIECHMDATLTYPYCKSHLESTVGVHVAPSTLSKDFEGLFASRDFKKGEHVGDYLGEEISMEECNQRYGTDDQVFAPYCASISRNIVIDSALVRCYTSFINHKGNQRETNCTMRHRKYKDKNGKWKMGLKIVTTRAVKQNEEFFFCYDSSRRKIDFTTCMHSTTLVLKMPSTLKHLKYLKPQKPLKRDHILNCLSKSKFRSRRNIKKTFL